MKFSAQKTILTFVYACSVSLLVGCGTPTKQASNTFEDLLGPTIKIQEKPQVITLRDLANSKVAFVTGSNFENYVTTWKETKASYLRPGANYDGGSAAVERDFALTAPEVVADQVVNLLRPNIRQLTFVPDLRAAQESGAKWILVFDMWPRFVGISISGAQFESLVSINVLTPNIERALKAEVLVKDTMIGDGRPGSSSRQYAAFIRNSVVQAVTKFNSSLTP